MCIRDSVQRRHAGHLRQEGAADLRRVGARLLHRLPQSAAQVRRGVLESGQLGFRGPAVRLIGERTGDRSVNRRRRFLGQLSIRALAFLISFGIHTPQLAAGSVSYTHLWYCFINSR